MCKDVVSDQSENMIQPLAASCKFLASPWEEIHLGVSWNRGTPKSSIFMVFSLINQPFQVGPNRFFGGFLNIYGNTAQQLAASKYKMLWVLALLEARLPRKFRKNASEHGNSALALGGCISCGCCVPFSMQKNRFQYSVICLMIRVDWRFFRISFRVIAYSSWTLLEHCLHIYNISTLYVYIFLLYTHNLTTDTYIYIYHIYGHIYLYTHI